MNMKHNNAYMSAWMSTRWCIYITDAACGTYIKVSDSDIESGEDEVGYGGLPTRDHVVLAGKVTRDKDDAVAVFGRTTEDGHFIGEPARVHMGNWLDMPNTDTMRSRIAEAILHDDELRWAVARRWVEKEHDEWVRRDDILADRMAQTRMARDEAYAQQQRRCIGATV